MTRIFKVIAAAVLAAALCVQAVPAFAAEYYDADADQEDKYTVTIDAGHQGSWVNMSDREPLGPGSDQMKAKATTGTQGLYTGVPEFALGLQISLMLQDELIERGYDVVMTREDNDTAVSNIERATIANEADSDIFIRIHANGSDNHSTNGALAMVPSYDNPYVGYLADDSYRLADCILNSYCETADFNNMGILYEDDMTGINWSQVPVMILEMGYMTNESDDVRMEDEDVQALMVSGIADGIDEYFAQQELLE